MSSISNQVLDIMKYISNQNYKVYLVGGAVRDLFSNEEIKDYDLVSDIPFDKLANYYELIINNENDNRNTAIIKDNKCNIRITQLKGNDIFDDLKERDFTINSIAIDSNMYVVDPYNGINDIRNRIIRVVDKNVFIKDPLKILRAIHLSATKRFSIEDNTKKLMREYRKELNNIVPEIILNELNKIILVDKPSKYIEENKEVLFELIDGLKDTLDFNQHNDYHEYDVFKHTLKVLDNTPNDINLRYAALFHDIGKPKSFFQDENGIGHFYGHSKASVELFNIFAEKYKIPKYNKELITKLIYYHDNELSTKRNKIIKFLKNYGTNKYELELLFSLKEADILGQNSNYINRLERNNYLENKYLMILNEEPTLKTSDLEINKIDLIELGFIGPEIGIILKNVLEKVINRELNNNKNEIINYINNELYNNNSINIR